ncbi:MAG: MATE family efflux transporter [Candidatus Limiplasma sp.]|nr:MATE family efflux transporter [Candidatus Limiplasma sp.]
MAAAQKHVDFTQGIIWKKLLLFCLPIVAGNLFQQLYTVMDAVILGRFVGKAGLAAVDSVYNLLKLPVNLFSGLSAGAAIAAAQHFGGKNREQLSRTVDTAVAFALAGGLLFSAISFLLAPALLRLLEIPPELQAMTLAYVRIYFGGLAPSLLYNVCGGILRAVGDSKTPFQYLAAANTLNVLLDLLLVGTLGWGVAGAALSTVLAQGVSAALALRALRHARLEGKPLLASPRFHPGALKAVFQMGLPIGLQSSLYPVANMMIQSSINRLGTDSIAAWALCGKLDLAVWLVIDSLGAAVSTFAAQNYGAGRYARLRRGVGAGMGTALGSVLFLSAALLLFSQPLGRLFLKAADEGILPLVGQSMGILAPFYFLCAVSEVLGGAIRGTGHTVKPMLLTLLGTCLCRAAWVLLAVPQRHTLGAILLGYPLSWLLTSLSMAAYYARFQKKHLPGSPAGAKGASAPAA